jgi:hypothetical protein
MERTLPAVRVQPLSPTADQTSRLLSRQAMIMAMSKGLHDMPPTNAHSDRGNDVLRASPQVSPNEEVSKQQDLLSFQVDLSVADYLQAVQQEVPTVQDYTGKAWYVDNLRVHCGCVVRRNWFPVEEDYMVMVRYMLRERTDLLLQDKRIVGLIMHLLMNKYGHEEMRQMMLCQQAADNNNSVQKMKKRKKTTPPGPQIVIGN